jgi:hypothetical protein
MEYIRLVCSADVNPLILGKDNQVLYQLNLFLASIKESSMRTGKYHKDEDRCSVRLWYMHLSEVNSHRKQNVFKSRHQNEGIKRYKATINKPSVNLTMMKYLQRTVTNRNLVHGQIMRKSNSSDACNHSLHNLLSSRLSRKK